MCSSDLDPTLLVQEPIDQDENLLSASLSSAGVELVAVYPLLHRLLVHPGCTDELEQFPNTNLLHLNPSLSLALTLRHCGFTFVNKERLLESPSSLPSLHAILTDLEPDVLRLVAQDLVRLADSNNLNSLH